MKKIIKNTFTALRENWKAIVFPKELALASRSMRIAFELYLFSSTFFFLATLFLLLYGLWGSLTMTGSVIAFFLYLLNLVFFMIANYSFTNFILAVVHDKTVRKQEQFCGLFIIFFVFSMTLFIASFPILKQFPERHSIFGTCGCTGVVIDGSNINTIN